MEVNREYQLVNTIQKINHIKWVM